MTKKALLIAAVLPLAFFGCKKDGKKDGDKAANPCGAKANPCGDKAKNPCGDKGKTPTATKNPCGDKAKNPCGNPCAGKAMAAAAPKLEGDFVAARVSHVPPNDNDPVVVKFGAVEVVKSSIKKLDDLTGSTAELSIDLAGLETGNGDRDKHLKNPDFFEVTKFAKATVKISKVKKSGDKAYDAQAEVNVHGVSQKWPVKFMIMASDADSVTVHGKHKLKLDDFKIKGNEKVNREVEVELKLKLKKS